MLHAAGLLPSSRDAAGFVTVESDRVLRLVNAEARPDFDAFLNSPLAQELAQAGRLVSTRFVEDPADGMALYSQERIPLISCPYESPPQMVWSAAELTLDLALGALDHGFGLKDATPYNILFRGPKPVFVEVPSFERRGPGDPKLGG